MVASRNVQDNRLPHPPARQEKHFLSPLGTLPRLQPYPGRGEASPLCPPPFTGLWMSKSALFKERIKRRGGSEEPSPCPRPSSAGGFNPAQPRSCRTRFSSENDPGAARRRSCSRGKRSQLASRGNGGKDCSLTKCFNCFFWGGCCGLRLFLRSWQSPPSVERCLKGLKPPLLLSPPRRAVPAEP